MTRDQQIIIDQLVDAARQVMHHDASEDSAAWRYEVETLTRKFNEILFAGPQPKRQRGAAR